jgi:hypothetical protein
MLNMENRADAVMDFKSEVMQFVGEKGRRTFGLAQRHHMRSDVAEETCFWPPPPDLNFSPAITIIKASIHDLVHLVHACKVVPLYISLNETLDGVNRLHVASGCANLPTVVCR